MGKTQDWKNKAVAMFERAGDVIKDAIYEYQGQQEQQPDDSLLFVSNPDDDIRVLYAEVTDDDIKTYGGKFKITSEDIKALVPSFYINFTPLAGDTVIKATSERLSVKGYSIDPAGALYILFLKAGV